MSPTPQADPPTWWQRATSLWGPGFDVHPDDSQQVAGAIGDWADLAPAEQAYAQSSLVFSLLDGLRQGVGELARLRGLVSRLDQGLHHPRQGVLAGLGGLTSEVRALREEATRVRVLLEQFVEATPLDDMDELAERVAERVREASGDGSDVFDEDELDDPAGVEPALRRTVATPLPSGAGDRFDHPETPEEL